MERWSNDGTFDISTETNIGKIQSITSNMEFSFELKIENMDSIEVDGYIRVLRIWDWFFFGIYKSKEASKFYIRHAQFNGLEVCNDICKKNPITFTNKWQKEFLSKVLMTYLFFCKYGFSIAF